MHTIVSWEVKKHKPLKENILIQFISSYFCSLSQSSEYFLHFAQSMWLHSDILIFDGCNFTNVYHKWTQIIVFSFCSSGSIVNNVNIGFASSSVPNATKIGKVLIDAPSNITAFTIDTSSISENGTRKICLIQSCQTYHYIAEHFLKTLLFFFFSLFAEVSYGVSHKISLLTASCMVLLSRLLSDMQ